MIELAAPPAGLPGDHLRDHRMAHAALSGNVREYCLIVEGAYLSESEAEHALRDPFIEDWVEQTGSFKINNMNEIQITPGVTLGSLGVIMLEEEIFEIASNDADHPLTEHKAKGVAEALRRQDMFDEVKVEPRDDVGNLSAEAELD